MIHDEDPDEPVTQEEEMFMGWFLIVGLGLVAVFLASKYINGG